jgi:hypothetical protein
LAVHAEEKRTSFTLFVGEDIIAMEVTVPTETALEG